MSLSLQKFKCPSHPNPPPPHHHVGIIDIRKFEIVKDGVTSSGMMSVLIVIVIIFDRYYWAQPCDLSFLIKYISEGYFYRGANKSLAQPPRYILFDGENILFDASLVMCINSTNIPPIVILNRIYEHQNLLSLKLVSFLVGLRTYQHPCTTCSYNYILICGVWNNWFIGLYKSYYFGFVCRRISSCKNWRFIPQSISCRPKAWLGAFFYRLAVLGLGVSKPDTTANLFCFH